MRKRRAPPKKAVTLVHRARGLYLVAEAPVTENHSLAGGDSSPPTRPCACCPPSGSTASGRNSRRRSGPAPGRLRRPALPLPRLAFAQPGSTSVRKHAPPGPSEPALEPASPHRSRADGPSFAALQPRILSPRRSRSRSARSPSTPPPASPTSLEPPSRPLCGSSLILASRLHAADTDLWHGLRRRAAQRTKAGGGRASARHAVG